MVDHVDHCRLYFGAAPPCAICLPPHVFRASSRPNGKTRLHGLCHEACHQDCASLRLLPEGGLRARCQSGALRIPQDPGPHRLRCDARLCLNDSFLQSAEGGGFSHKHLSRRIHLMMDRRSKDRILPCVRLGLRGNGSKRRQDIIPHF